MAKHIIIAGPPRAGKSTISKLLSQAYPYQHISMDSIIAGIERVFPETGINSDAEGDGEVNIRYISKRIAQFIQAMIDSGEYDECPYGMVIDICQLLPEDYVRYIDSEVCAIYYFGTSDVSATERLEILNANDTPEDYSYGESDEKKRKLCEEIVALSGVMKKQCKQYQLPYYETARNRAEAIRTFITLLEKQNT